MEKVKMTQVHYRVPSDAKAIVDDYTKIHHTTSSNLLRSAYKKMALKMKADLLSEKLGKALAEDPVDKDIKTDQDIEKWLFKA